jgi:hypothetical protein
MLNRHGQLGRALRPPDRVTRSTPHCRRPVRVGPSAAFCGDWHPAHASGRPPDVEANVLLLLAEPPGRRGIPQQRAEVTLEVRKSRTEQVGSRARQRVHRSDDVVLGAFEDLPGGHHDAIWADESSCAQNAVLVRGSSLRQGAAPGSADPSEVGLRQGFDALSWRTRERQRLCTINALVRRGLHVNECSTGVEHAPEQQRRPGCDRPSGTTAQRSPPGTGQDPQGGIRPATTSTQRWLRPLHPRLPPQPRSSRCRRRCRRPRRREAL